MTVIPKAAYIGSSCVGRLFGSMVPVLIIAVISMYCSYVADAAINNPLGFIDPEASPPNYSLDGTSPLVVDIGVTTSITTDFEGDPRPTGDQPDFGADEFVP